MSWHFIEKHWPSQVESHLFIKAQLKSTVIQNIFICLFIHSAVIYCQDQTLHKVLGYKDRWKIFCSQNEYAVLPSSFSVTDTSGTELSL